MKPLARPTTLLLLMASMLSPAGCGGEDDEERVGDVALAGTKTQGTKTQGTKTQGTTLTSNLLHARYAGGTRGAETITGLQVVRGELRGAIARSTGPVTLTGTDFVDTYLWAKAPESASTFKLWVRSVTGRVGSLGYRGTDESLSTRLYDVRVLVNTTWQPLCATDPMDGTSWAVPVAAIWNETGDRVESATSFTFACSSGVIAKCYGWGYRPWIDTAHRDAHQACTRAARADYCGDGKSHTVTGTEINVYDQLSPVAQTRDVRPDLLFEAGWTTAGARCLSHYRWAHLPIVTPTDLCPTPGRATPFPQPGDPSTPAGMSCRSGYYLGQSGVCVPAFTGLGGTAGWVCESCIIARILANSLKMSLPIWECEDSANNVFTF